MINKANDNSVSQSVFQYIKENGGVTLQKAKLDLVDCGFRVNSVTSLISQMVTQGMVLKEDGYLWTMVDEYRPLRMSRKKKYSRNPVAKALAIVAKQQPEVAVVRMTTAKVLDSMSVKEAHALYLELLSMFGESK